MKSVLTKDDFFDNLTPLNIRKCMAEPTTEPGNLSQFEQFENKLDKAKAPMWAECPAWVKTEVSPLLRFVSSPDLQRDLTAPDAQARFTSERIVDHVSDEYIDTLRSAAHSLIQNYMNEAIANGDKVNAYHNAEHDRQAVDRVARLLKITHPRVSTQVAEAIIVAATYHDVLHPGGPAKLREGDGLSYEQRSLIAADAVAQNSENIEEVIGESKTFTLEQRVMVASAIIGTTFGDPMVKPYTQVERIMKLADIGGYMEDRKEWIDQSIEVANEYANLDNYAKDELPPPFVVAWLVKPNLESAVAEWLQGQTNFINYELLKPHQEFHQLHVDAADASAQSEWALIDDSLQEKVAMINTLKQTPGDEDHRAVMTSIRASLTDIMARDRERVIERMRVLKTSGELDEMYNKIAVELSL